MLRVILGVASSHHWDTSRVIREAPATINVMARSDPYSGIGAQRVETGSPWDLQHYEG